MVEISVWLEGVYDLWPTLRPLQRGAADPTMVRDQSGIWRGLLTPEGAASMRIQPRVERSGVSIRVHTYGPGAAWAARTAPDLFGANDKPDTFRMKLVGLRQDKGWSAEQQLAIEFVAREYLRTSWRLPRSHGVWEALLAAVLEQKVTSKESIGAWRALTCDFGDLAPGPVPVGLRVPPTPRQVRRVPSWRWRRMAVDRPRSDTLMRLCRMESALARLSQLELSKARTVLTNVRGVGDWTYAELAQRALGDADAVSVGDYHLARMVTYSILGRNDGTDQQMLHLLQPFAGDRYRAVRMIELVGRMPPRRGPRMSIPSYRYG